MTHKAAVNLVLLFDDEMRIAAQALAIYRATNPRPTEQFLSAAQTALDACAVALLGAEAPDCVLALTSKNALSNYRLGPPPTAPGGDESLSVK